MEYKENEYDLKYATHVWKHYTSHFQTFKEIGCRDAGVLSPLICIVQTKSVGSADAIFCIH